MRLAARECERSWRSSELVVKIVIGRKFVGDRMESNEEFLSFHLARKRHVQRLEFDKLHF